MCGNSKDAEARLLTFGFCPQVSHKLSELGQDKSLQLNICRGQLAGQEKPDSEMEINELQTQGLTL